MLVFLVLVDGFQTARHTYHSTQQKTKYNSDCRNICLFLCLNKTTFHLSVAKHQQIKYKFSRVSFDCLCMTIKTLRFPETSMTTVWHGVTSQKAWLLANTDVRTSNLATEKKFYRMFKTTDSLSRWWTVWPTGAIFTLKVTKEEEQSPDNVVDRAFLGNFTRHLQLHFTVNRSSVSLGATSSALISSVNKDKFVSVQSTETLEGVQIELHSFLTSALVRFRPRKPIAATHWMSGIQSGVCKFRRRTHSLPHPGIKLRFLCLPVHSLVVVLTTPFVIP